MMNVFYLFGLALLHCLKVKGVWYRMQVKKITVMINKLFNGCKYTS